MGDCCEATDRHFDDTRAKEDLACYHERGPDAPTRMLLKGIGSESLSGASLLDIGGGIGALVHELLGEQIAAAEAEVFQRVYRRRSFLWEAAVYRRRTRAPAQAAPARPL